MKINSKSVLIEHYLIRARYLFGVLIKNTYILTLITLNLITKFLFILVYGKTLMSY